MRTTIRLPDQLYDTVRETARREGITVTAYIERSLRRAVHEPVAAPQPFRLDPMTGQGLQPGVDLDDTASLLDLMDAVDDLPDGPGRRAGA